MTVRAEFFGIPRQRADRDSIEIEATTLGELMQQLTGKLPKFSETCLLDGQLRSGYLANINGRMFTSDPATVLQSGDSVMILSADVGG